MATTKVTDAFERRVEMVNGRFDLPAATVDAMGEIRAAADVFARALAAVRTNLGAANVDYGRFVAAVDLVQQAKNVACDAVILVHATRDASPQK